MNEKAKGRILRRRIPSTAWIFIVIFYGLLLYAMSQNFVLVWMGYTLDEIDKMPISQPTSTYDGYTSDELVRRMANKIATAEYAKTFYLSQLGAVKKGADVKRFGVFETWKDQKTSRLSWEKKLLAMKADIKKKLSEKIDGVVVTQEDVKRQLYSKRYAAYDAILIPLKEQTNRALESLYALSDYVREIKKIYKISTEIKDTKRLRINREKLNRYCGKYYATESLKGDIGYEKYDELRKSLGQIKDRTSFIKMLLVNFDNYKDGVVCGRMHRLFVDFERKWRFGEL